MQIIKHEIDYPFLHHRLEAYHLSLRLIDAARQFSLKIPRGYRSLADQLNRAALSTSLNIAEGANKLTDGEKRHCFTRARGECGELAAAIEIATVLSFVDVLEAREITQLASKVCAMLTGLIKRLS